MLGVAGVRGRCVRHVRVHTHLREALWREGGVTGVHGVAVILVYDREKFGNRSEQSSKEDLECEFKQKNSVSQAKAGEGKYLLCSGYQVAQV